MAPQNKTQGAAEPTRSSAATSGSAQLPTIADDTILVDDKLYSWKKLAATHPGGELFVKSFAGRDATEAFMSYHRRLFPHETQAHALVGTTPTVTNANYTDDYLELCAEVSKVLPKHKSFAPPSYYLKIIVLLSVSIYIEMYMHVTGNYCGRLCAVLGLCFAFIGLNVQHDANHGSISRSAWLNRVLGMSQNWIGGSAVSWIHQHVVQHHIYCNDVHDDPDIMGGSLIRINPLRPLIGYQAFQYVYVFVMIAGFGFKQIFSTLGDTLAGKNFTLYALPLRQDHTAFEVSTSFLFMVRWAVLPFFGTLVRGGSPMDAVWALAATTPMYVVAGYYLAFFFIISHNFEGVHAFDRSKHAPNDTSPESHNRFLYRQVVSSSNVGGPLLAVLNGGLNYQIEHHLFPRVQHSHYATIAPIVRDFCRRKNIPYRHFPTVSDNVLSCVKHLFTMGHYANKGMIEE